MNELKKECDEWINYQALAWTLSTGGNLYHENQDGVIGVGLSTLEFLGTRIRVEGETVIQLVVDSDNERYLSATERVMRIEVGSIIFDGICESEWFTSKHGYAKAVFKEIEDKDYYQIRAFMALGCSGEKLPKILKSRECVWDSSVRIFKYNGIDIFKYDHSQNNFTGFSSLMRSERLSKLVSKSERRRCVREGLLRDAISTHLGWTFKTVNSVQEHHFHWSEEKSLIVCKYNNDDDTKTYSIGKGLKKIAFMMGVDEPSSDEIKKVSLHLESFGKGKLVVVGGSDIVHYYLDEQLDKDQRLGSLNGGCMRWERYSDSIENMYSGNASMLVLKSLSNTDKILGRANLWITDDGKKFMDRIYGDEAHHKLFNDWANDNGYISRRWQSYDSPSQLRLPNETGMSHIKLQVTIDMDFFDGDEDGYETPRVPYMDTFKYLNASNGMLQNFAPERGEEGMWFNVENTDGYASKVCTDGNMSYRWENMIN
tara:strand:- start:781 stop:2232 length:1452 start_codon:yes stop_codon:yes gene_type:complete